MPAISIIIPVYNSIASIARCVNSILAQSFQNWDLWIIDDGSTDGSSDFCDSISQQDKRIHAHHQENSGVMAARKAGFELSTGEFIFFVDADDSLEPHALEHLISLMSPDIDIVISDHLSLMDINMTSEEYACRVLKYRSLQIWGKLYRRRILEGDVLEIPRYFRVGEDFLSQLNLIRNISGEVRFTKENVYLYTQASDTSVQRSFHPTYEYECKMISAAQEAIDKSSPSTIVTEAFISWKLSYLGGMIGLKYPIDYTSPWVVRLVEESHNMELSLMERLILFSCGHRFTRIILHILNKAFSFARRIKQTIQKYA